MNDVSVAEQELLEALAAAVRQKSVKGFDPSSLIGMVWNQDDKHWGAALDALLPNGRYRTGYFRGSFRDRPVRQLLQGLVRRDLLDTDVLGWCYVHHAAG